METARGLEGLEPRRRAGCSSSSACSTASTCGHAYLLEHLVREAAARGARPTVITFDHHPDEVLTGLGAAAAVRPRRARSRGSRRPASSVTVVVHFDQRLRETPYDAFVGQVAARVRRSPGSS